MPINFQPYRPPSPWDFQGVRPTTTDWGPKDVSKQLQEGIGSLYSKYRQAYGEKYQQDISEEALKAQLTPGGQAAALAGPGGPYATGSTGGGGAAPSGYNTGGKLPEFAQGGASDAAGLLRQFEGYRDKPYWDVNAHRIGYGSDTITDPVTGAVRPVRPGDKIDKAAAEADLARRIPEFQATISKQVPIFAELPANVQAGLTSVAYNYGSLPNSVVAAVQTRDPAAIAAAVAGLAGHNKGVNAERRRQEAAVILSGGQLSAPGSIAPQQRAPLRQEDQAAILKGGHRLLPTGADPAMTPAPPPIVTAGANVQGGPAPNVGVPITPQQQAGAVPLPPPGGPTMQMPPGTAPGQQPPPPPPANVPPPQEQPHPTGPGPSPIEQAQVRNPTPVTQSSQPLFAPPGGTPPVGTPSPMPQGPQAPDQPALAGPATVTTAPPPPPPPQPPTIGNPVVGNPAAAAPGARPMQMPPGTEGPAAPPPQPPPQPAPVQPPQPAPAAAPPPVAPSQQPGGGGPATTGGIPQIYPSAAGGQTGVLTDRHRRMLALAAASGNPSLLKSAEAIVQSETGIGKAGATPWKLVPDGRGGFMRFNEATGEAPTYIGGIAQTPEGDVIVAPPNPKSTPEEQALVRKARLEQGIPETDNRTWRIKTNERGAKFREPLDDRESKDFEHIQTLSGKLEQNETVKTYRKAVDAVASMEQAFRQQNAAGDINGLVQVFKTIDPTSTVSKGEGDTIIASGGADAWLQNWANKINQSGIMTPQMRADFMNAARDQLRVRNTQASSIVEGTRRQAKLAGLDQDAATGYFQDTKIFQKPRYTADEFGARPVDPKGGVRIGDVVGDNVYIGGPVNDPKSWRASQ